MSQAGNPQLAIVGDSNQERVHIALNQELRKIEGFMLTKLSSIIDNSNDYNRLLEELTRPKGRPLGGLNLSMDAINLIKHQIHCGKSPSMALLNYWAITGRRRPTVGTLLAYLRLCNLKWAEDYVLQEILGLKHDLKPHATSVTKPLPVSSDLYSIEDSYKFQDLDELSKRLTPDCERFSFDLIYQSTNKFCHKPHNFKTKSGTKIGEGRFSSVYRAKTRVITEDDGANLQIVAAKLLKSECNKVYLINEINLISKVSHENVLELLGIALGAEHDKGVSYMCLIYPYMENGSLLDCIGHGLPTRDLTYLSWPERMNISLAVVRGIAYLHNFEQGPIIHRDIKTANILIDANLEPKLGDFTLVRQLDKRTMHDTQFSQNIIGTSVYMPPEAFRGDISIKFDSFSFGIVLLELLTGMRPFNEELDEDLLTYINERLSDLEDGLSSSPELTAEQAKDEFLAEIVDKRADNIRADECKTIFGLAMQATETKKSNRPTISEILAQLEQLISPEPLR